MAALSGNDGDPWLWAAHSYQLLAPAVHVRGRMALLVLGVVLWAFLWLLWRAYTVISTDNDILVEKLGLDIPPEPTLTLEEIAARQIQISWKPEEAAASILEYHVELNGIRIGITKKHETAAVISNLSPGTLYELRIFSESHGRFQTPSRTLHIRTCKASGTESLDSSNDGNPIVRPLAPRLPSVPVIQPPPPSTRDQNAPQTAARRGTMPRKISPAGPTEQLETREPDDEPGEDLAELSQQFSEINTEIDNIEAAIQEEVREFEASKKEKEEQRQTYLEQVKERDEASNDLKRQVHRAEATARSLLSDKTKKEKQLKEKENRRQKKINEMAQWDESAKTIEEEIDAINKQKEAHRKRMESQIREVKEKIAEEQREIQQLEEENKDKATQLKDLQEERKRNSADEETEESREADRRDQERDAKFRHDLAGYSQQYNHVWSELQKQQQELVLRRQRLAMMETARRATAVQFAPMAPIDMDAARRTNRFGRGRHTSSHGSNVSSPRVAYAPEPFSSVNEAVATSSPLATRQQALINQANGMPTFVPFDAVQAFPDDDEDSMLPMPMSPRADSLLPTNLLGEDSEDDLPPSDEEDMPMKPTATTSQHEPFPTFKPGSMHGIDPPDQEPGSPSPGSTSSPRSFASPREEFFRDDPDRRSVHSSHPPIPEESSAPSGTQQPPVHKRLTSMSNLFSFNRARGKTSSENQPPALGSLKHESLSFPRKTEDVDPSLQPKRRLSYGGTNWSFNGDEDQPKSFTRRAFPSLLPGLGKSSASRNYDPFAPRTGSIDPNGRGGSSSPRPGSTYSYDVLPRPSVEQVSWEFKPGQRNSPLMPDWASAISRSHSRRPSLGFASSTNLSLRPDDTDGEFIEPKRDARPLQAPIGTRPTSSSQQRPQTPKLNPNAPTFTMFNFGKNKDKDRDKKDKATKVKDEGSLANSPPDSRKSKDTHSIAPTMSTMESRESLERTTSGYSAGASPSLESTPNNTANKPTFISKITRKASSNKFDSWKTKSTSLFSSRTSSHKTPGGLEATTPTGEITEDDALAGSTEQLGRSMESTSSTPNAQTPTSAVKDPGDIDKKGSRTSLGSWNFMRKKPKQAPTSAGTPQDLISENGEITQSESGQTTDLESLRERSERGSLEGSGGSSRPTT